MYKYCLFDLDGTLTQSEFGILKAVEYALAVYDKIIILDTFVDISPNVIQ